MNDTNESARFGLISSIICPRCSNLMRLRTMEAKEDGSGHMTFECSCGFDYRQSQQAQKERQRFERAFSNAPRRKRLGAGGLNRCGQRASLLLERTARPETYHGCSLSVGSIRVHMQLCSRRI